MKITREQIEARLEKLQSSVAQLQADLNAHQGAIQDCQHWLLVIDMDEPVTESVSSALSSIEQATAENGMPDYSPDRKD